MRHILYTGNGTAPPGVARPHVGRFFTVEDDGALRYFRYDGFGEQDPTGANGFVGNNSGNQIGRGFGHFLHVLGGGNGIILAVAPNGDLTWFRYTGAGEHDPSGTNGFVENNPGNVIGNGFHSFRHLFVSPREGQTTATTIFAVNENGDLLWFQYEGHGEHDPTGVRGFPGPNQGNQIGNGFLGFRRIVGIGDGAFLAIRDNGDMLWFRYTGNGELDPSGTNGFVDNNSGNQIGNGFDTVRHLFGGVTDRPGLEGQSAPARVIYFVDANGDLRWLRYGGNGEEDPTGSLGFDGPNQGNQIGNGFSASRMDTTNIPRDPVERLGSAIESANQEWKGLPEEERNQPESLPAPQPLAVLCAQYKESAALMHAEARSASQAGFSQLAKVATELAHEYDEFVRIACPPPVE
ncbi:mucin-5AC [Nocardioidaceae bacterium Broad-1]|nr:mucin-5AC [Nocardioidaceae bacterium Broad-1]